MHSSILNFVRTIRSGVFAMWRPCPRLLLALDSRWPRSSRCRRTISAWFSNDVKANPALELIAASGPRALAVPSSPRSSAAAQRERLGSMKPALAAITCLVIGHHALATQPNSSCPATTVLPQLDAAYHACANGYVDGSCQRFIEAFKRVTGRYDCQRSFDTAPVPAVWLAPTGALDDFVRLAWHLASERQFNDKLYKDIRTEARTFFGSEEFRGILDGALAEEYLQKSKAVERALKR